MTPNEIGKQLINKIENEMGGTLNGQDDYLEGKGTQFSFELNGKSYSVDLWDESIVDDFNKWHSYLDTQIITSNKKTKWLDK